MIYLYDDDVRRLAKETVPESEYKLIAPFLKTYYALALEKDLTNYSPQRLFTTAYQHFQQVLTYSNKEDLVHVYNPKNEDQYSVIDIVAKDRSFLIDSLQMLFAKEKIAIRFVTHPIYHLKFSQGKISELQNAVASHSNNISVSHIECEALDEIQLAKLGEKITQLLAQNKAVADDTAVMQDRVQMIIQDIQSANITIESPQKTQETMQFLNWLQQGYFTFLGYREYEFRGDDLYRVPHSGLGVLRSDGTGKKSQSFSALPKHLQDEVHKPNLLRFAKSSRLSQIHRPAYMDFIGIKRFDDNGQVIGEYRFLGLLTEDVYRLPPEEIPLLSAKINTVLTKENFPINSYALKSLTNILSRLPHDELFQSNAEEIRHMAISVLRMQDRDILRFFARKDVFETFVMCYIYVPKDRYNTKLQARFERYLLTAFNGYESNLSTVFSDTLPIRIDVLIRTHPGQIAKFDPKKIETALTPMMFDWGDEVLRLLCTDLGNKKGKQLYKSLYSSTPNAYQDRYTPDDGVKDLQILASLKNIKEKITLHLYQDPDQESELHLKLYGLGELVLLSDIMPLLENFGFIVKSASPYQFEDQGQKNCWLIHFSIGLQQKLIRPLHEIEPNFIQSFTRNWTGIDESDTLNQLVISSGFAPRDVRLLRAISKYMIQAKAPFSKAYMHKTINNNIDIAQDLVALFHTRMGLKVDNRKEETQKLQQTIEEKLAQVSSLDEDRILRWFMIVINAMIRTNFYQKDDQGKDKSFLSFKLQSAKIPDLPLPKPLYEIFVYSSDVEAIHLRGGKVARGGLRWSDRVEDFRTEVLGLVKAQNVKNTVIVPVGSKGGFIVKHPDNSSREAFMQKGICCYKIFMNALLDITDNIVAGKIIPPQDVYRYDDDDPYLVVAADKGTASFSDIANGIAQEHGFWLGDAFASGGSVGYDHKGMGITARGAWESVKRHFRYLGKNIQEENFTVVGIGDMSGDVFGNGMLLSKKTQLLAAFNHMHIFIDPTPDEALSFAERQRLFTTPRTTWADFDKNIISQGGGVFSRSDKYIKITPEMKQVFSISQDKLSPTELIKHLLKAPVDLLWNGGIGTYVKAESETHAMVGDKANDALRINGNELQCKVIGEGGNLGFTQLGRVEFAKKGGMVLTDAIDNSAGVNCSDHEVNIKILLNQRVESGHMSVNERNTLLESMTEEVGQHVLIQNQQQPLAISLDAVDKAQFNAQKDMIAELEKTGHLNRNLEFFPSDKTLQKRIAEGTGLYTPELSVLLAYAKIQLFDEFLASDLPDSKQFISELSAYFPSALYPEYIKEMQNHRLHREIIATYVTNAILNNMGTTFIYRMKKLTGQECKPVVQAYSVAHNIIIASEYKKQIDALDNIIETDLQDMLYLNLRTVLQDFTLWFLRQYKENIPMDKLTQKYATLATVTKQIPLLLSADIISECETKIKALTQQSVPQNLARDLVYMPHWKNALNIMSLAEKSHIDIETIAKLSIAMEQMNQSH